MAMAYVQKTSNNGFGSSPSLTLTLTAGNFMWVVIAGHNPTDSAYPSSISDNQSNSYSTFTQRNDQTDLYLTVYKVANVTGGSTTVSITLANSSDYSVAALEYSGGVTSGGDLGNQFDSGNFASSGDSGSLFTFTGGMCLATEITNTPGTITNTGSFTERVNIASNNVPMSITDLLPISNGSHSNTWSFSTASNYQGIIAAWQAFVPPATKPFLLQDFAV